MTTRRLHRMMLVAALATFVGMFLAPNQLAAQQSTTSPKAATKKWRVRVKQNGAYFLTVQAREVPLVEIAADLSRRLKAPVVLSRVMQKQLVTVEFADLPLESALQMMAPLPYVHYELRGSSAPVCREVFLNAYNEVAPLPKFENKNVSFVMQGDTEADSKDDPLQVSYKNQRFSISVKKQSLTAVLDRMASLMGVNFSMDEDSEQTIDLDFKDVPLEDVMNYFPPSVHLHLRKDLQRFSSLPLLLEFENKIH